jgi:hypothetical protein
LEQGCSYLSISAYQPPSLLPRNQYSTLKVPLCRIFTASLLSLSMLEEKVCVMAKKRTYSTHDKRRALQQDVQRKRNSAQPKFSGPVSFSESNEESSTELKSTGGLLLFDKALQGRLKPTRKMSQTIHGSFEEFAAFRSYLPTPPSEMQTQQVQHANRFFPALKGAASLATQVTKPAWTTAAKSNTVENTPEPEEPKEPYAPREYKASKSSAPHRNVLRDRLSPESEEAEL